MEIVVVLKVVQHNNLNVFNFKLKIKKCKRVDAGEIRTRANEDNGLNVAP